jgi:hypothetical protein
MAGTYRWQRVAIGFGLVAVALGSLCYTAAVWANAPVAQVGAWVISGVTAFLAYSVLAAAAWMLLSRLERQADRDTKVIAIVGLFALGSGLLWVGRTAELVNFVRRQVTWSFSDHTQVALLGNFILPAVGLLAVTVGSLAVCLAERSKSGPAIGPGQPALEAASD